MTRAAVDALTASHTAPVVAGMKAAIQEMAALVVDRLRADARPVAALVASPGGEPFDLVTFNLFDEAAWVAAVERHVADAVTDVVVDAASGQPFTQSLKISDDAVAAAVRRHVGRLRDVAPELRQSVASTLETAVRNRTPLDDTIRNLSETGGLSPVQAESWATNELTAAANGGLQAAWNGVVPFKRWSAVGDTKTRETHLAASGQIVPTGQDFEVAGVNAEYPGDPRLPVGERINCRCTLDPVDAEGTVRADRLEDASRDDLRHLAAQLGIPGRSGMRKPELVTEINRWRAGFGRQRLDQMNRAQLLNRAKGAGIVGRHRMTNPELTSRLRPLAEPGRQRVDDGYMSVSELRNGQQILRGLRAGAHAVTMAASLPDPATIRQATYAVFDGPTVGCVPCVVCGARLQAALTGDDETMTVARISTSRPWTAAGNTYPVCAAHAVQTSPVDGPDGDMVTARTLRVRQSATILPPPAAVAVLRGVLAVRDGRWSVNGLTVDPSTVRRSPAVS